MPDAYASVVGGEARFGCAPDLRREVGILVGAQTAVGRELRDSVLRIIVVEGRQQPVYEATPEADLCNAAASRGIRGLLAGGPIAGNLSSPDDRMPGGRPNSETWRI